MVCAPRFDDGRARYRVEQAGKDRIFISEGQDGLRLRLRCSRPVEIKDGDAVACLHLRPDESAFSVFRRAA